MSQKQYGVVVGLLKNSEDIHYWSLKGWTDKPEQAKVYTLAGAEKKRKSPELYSQDPFPYDALEVYIVE